MTEEELSELRDDMTFALREGLKDLTVAHQRRLDELEKARLVATETRRLTIEKGRQEHIERLKGILSRNPTRWTCSIDGQLVVPSRKGAHVRFECPQCKAELPQVLQDLGSCMEITFQKFWNEDFTNGGGRPYMINSDTVCACGKKCLFRAFGNPY